MISIQSSCFKISSGREIQGLDLTASIIGSQQCGVNISSWPQACVPFGGCLFHGTTRLNFPIYSGVGKHLVLASSLAFHAEGVLHHGTTRLNLTRVEQCGYTWVQAMVYTRLSLIVSSMLSSCYYYSEAKGRAANYFFLVRVTMIALIMRIVLA